MIFAIPVGLLLVLVVFSRVGEVRPSPDLPLTWPSTGYIGSPPERRMPTIVFALAGFVGGISWGAVARGWMRLISTDPEFTVAGTFAILIGFGLLFAGAGLCLGAHRNGWRRWARGAARVLGCLLILPAFGGAGALAFPSVVLGALAVARWDFRVPVRVLLASLAVGVTVLVSITQIVDDDLAAWRSALGTMLYPVLLWPMVLAARLPLVRIIHDVQDLVPEAIKLDVSS